MLPKHRYIYRLTIALLLVFIFGWQIVSPLPAAAQTPPAFQLTAGTAVRYNTGISFTLKASTTQGKIEKAELRYRLGKDGLEQSRAAEKFSAAAVVTAETRLTESQDDLAAGMPVIYYWIVTGSNGQQQSSEKRTVYYEDNRFQWREINGPAVTLRWYRGDDRYGQQMYNLAADSLNTLKKRFSLQTGQQIYISIYATRQDFFAVAPPNTPTWAGGMAYLERSEITLIAPQDNLASIRIGEGLPHEVAHIAVYQTVGRQLPRWFDEGFAVYTQNVKSEDYYRIAKAAYEQKQLLNFSSLNSIFPSDSDEANLAYAQSASFIDFMVSRYGDVVIANLFDQLRSKDLEEAMRATFGVGMAELVPQWQNFLQGKLISLPPAAKTAPVTPQAAAISNSASRMRLIDGGGDISGKSGSQFVPSNLVYIGLVVAATFVLLGLCLGIAIFTRKRVARPKLVADYNGFAVYPTAAYQPPANSYPQNYTNPPTNPATPANNYSNDFYVYPVQPRPWQEEVIITPPPAPATSAPDELDPLDFIRAQFGQPPHKD